MYDFISRTIISETFDQGDTTMNLKVDTRCVVLGCSTQTSIIAQRRPASGICIVFDAPCESDIVGLLENE